MKRKILIILLIIIILSLLGYLFFFIQEDKPQDICKISIRNKLEIPHSRKTVLDTSKQNILLIGDSMAYSLMFAMKHYCNYNNHDLNVVSWVAASSKDYALCDTLDYFINEFKPTIIFFVIGANEMFVKDLDFRKQYIKTIREKTKHVKTLFIGPPNWRNDTGINNIMMGEFSDRKFFLSKNLKFTRINGDKVHPDRKSGRMWMDSIALWTVNQSYYPIRLDNPPYDNPIHVDFVKLVKTN